MCQISVLEGVSQGQAAVSDEILDPRAKLLTLQGFLQQLLCGLPGEMLLAFWSCPMESSLSLPLGLHRFHPWLFWETWHLIPCGSPSPLSEKLPGRTSPYCLRLPGISKPPLIMVEKFLKVRVGNWNVSITAPPPPVNKEIFPETLALWAAILRGYSLWVILSSTSISL